MKYAFLLFLFCLASPARGDSVNATTGERVIDNAVSNGDMKLKVKVGSTPTTAITITGTTGAVTAPVSFSTPSITGMTTPLTIAQGGTNGITATAGFDNLSPMTAAGDLIYGGTSGTRTRLAPGTSVQLLHSGTTPTWSAVSLTADVTGVLPLANGGSNKNATAVNGGLVWSDADSFEITAAGTASQWVLSGGAGTPTMTNTTTTAKTIDGTADAVQLQIEGHSTQTSDILNVRKSDGTTSLLQVTNTAGTAVRGTTLNTGAATGFVGEYLENRVTSLTSTGASGAFFDTCSITLTAGEWEVSGTIEYKRNGATFSSTVVGVGLSGASGVSGTGLSTPVNFLEQNDVVPLTFTFYDAYSQPLRVRSNGTDLDIVGSTYSSVQIVYLKGRISAFTGTPQYICFMQARRMR